MNDPISLFKNAQHEQEYMNAYDKALELWPIPYETTYISTKFGETHVIICGKADGEPMVLMPGAGDSATMWYGNVEALATKYKIYAIDIIGDWGKSQMRSQPSSRKDMADWMNEVIKRLELEKPHIIGLSFGGFLTINFACYYPDDVDKIVLLAPAATFQQFSLMFFIQSLSAMFLPFRWRAEGFFNWLIAEGNRYDNAFHEQCTIGFMYGSAKLKIHPTVLSDTELKGIQNPVLLLVGDQEVIYDGFQVVKRAQDLIPNIQAEFIPHCGHHIPTEKPGYVNERIRSFLNEK